MIETSSSETDLGAAVAGAAWSKACSTLRGELGEDTFGSWIAPARLRCGRGGRLVVVTPTGLARDWIKRNAWRRLGELWSQSDPEHRRLDIKCRTEFEDEEGGARQAPSSPEAEKPSERLAVQAAPSSTLSSTPMTYPAPAAAPVGRPAGLNDRFTFDSFVAGPSNEFALGVARRIAAWSDGCFNPVFFHGPYGFGKTHLLNAIAWEAARARPEARIVYLTAERFTSSFVKALMDRSAPGFKSELRSADLLLVDDVHFIGGKKSSEEELFHTLAALMGEGRRVVFASDRAASALADVDARLRSHMGQGLVCGIEAADRALRLGILECKLSILSRTLELDGRARPEVLQFLADRFTDSVRELEGGLNTLVARAGERLSKLSLDEVQAIVRPHLRETERRITVDDIQKTVADHYGLKQSDLLCERRTRAVARPRHVAMYLAKQLTTRSYPDIGRRFGGRDHTTVLHAVKRIEALKAEDPMLAGDLDLLARKLKG
ncbi:chromosomal replication initiator protein DnaA [Caulobacter sp. S45]|uniref:chromosomal replication initiator protein DnaA n=1 Tax=Caulobacter sp. S45 TaxID=1641861 RepID=UPI00352FF926